MLGKASSKVSDLAELNKNLLQSVNCDKYSKEKKRIITYKYRAE